MTSFHPRKYDSSLFTENVLPMTSGVTKYTLAQYAPFPYYSNTVFTYVHYSYDLVYGIKNIIQTDKNIILVQTEVLSHKSIINIRTQ